METVFDVVIIGAGQAGLAAGYYLQRHDVDFAIVEANEAIGGSWQHYWDSLRVFSPARYSKLPGMDFPGDPKRYPSRDEVIAYLQAYAAHFRMPVLTEYRVQQVYKHAGLFSIQAADGRCIQARVLIVAAGPFNRPYVPDIPCMEMYKGRTLHSYQYRRPDSFRGERIVVVGANNSAVQIGVELAKAADVTLAARREIEWLPKYFMGKSIFFWIHDTGFDMLPLGYWFDLEDTNHVLDDGTYQAAIEAGEPNTRRMFTRFTEDGVLWPGGQHEAVDTVLFATGFRPDNVPFLDTLDALDENNRPRERGGVSTNVDGLFYVGVFGQRTAASATLRGVGPDAKRIVKQAVQYLNRAGTA